jgi:hypothetical protein
MFSFNNELVIWRRMTKLLNHICTVYALWTELFTVAITLKGMSHDLTLVSVDGYSC